MRLLVFSKKWLQVTTGTCSMSNLHCPITLESVSTIGGTQDWCFNTCTLSDPSSDLSPLIPLDWGTLAFTTCTPSQNSKYSPNSSTAMPRTAPPLLATPPGAKDAAKPPSMLLSIWNSSRVRSWLAKLPTRTTLGRGPLYPAYPTVSPGLCLLRSRDSQ